MWKEVVEFLVPGQPFPKERPKVGRGRGYTPTKTVVAEARVALKFAEAMRSRSLSTDARYWLDVRFFRDNRVRVDLDNLVKLVSDAMFPKGGVADDSQIDRITATKEVATTAHTLVKLYEWREDD